MPWWTPTSRRTKGRPTLTALFSYAAVSIFLTVFLFLGLLTHIESPLRKKPKYDFPDFDRIKPFTRVLSGGDVHFGDSHNRIIIMGDVHGMNQSLHELLDGLSYSPQQDTVFFAGDLLAKSSHSTSMSVIDYLTKNHVAFGKERMFPVRGNHDHMIVQWRSWREWFEGLTLTARASPAPRLFPASLSSFVRRLFLDPMYDGATGPPASTGREFLQLIEAEWAIARMEKDADPEEHADVARKRARGTWREEWWNRIPPPGKGREKQQWRLFGDHYWLARDITSEQASYLTSLPLVLHVPSLHLFVTHAGLLPSDPRLTPTNRHQPLARKPVLSARSSGVTAGAILNAANTEATFQTQIAASDIPALRLKQESALLTDVPQNTDPWVVLNMRSVTKKHKVTRKGDKGKPWSKIWNQQMRACHGFDGELSTDSLDDAEANKGKDEEYELPCYPATVVYGHAATRGLDIKRWSFGIDTGCLYGQKLTALVLRNTSASVADGVRGGWFEDDDDGDDDDEEEEDDDDDEHEHEGDGDEDEDKEEGGGESGSRPRRKHLRFGDVGAGIDAKLFSIQCPDLDY